MNFNASNTTGGSLENRSGGAAGLWVTYLLGATLTVMWLLGTAGNAYTLAVTRSAAPRRTGSVYIYVAKPGAGRPALPVYHRGLIWDIYQCFVLKSNSRKKCKTFAFKVYVGVLFLTTVLVPGLVMVLLYAGLAKRYWATQARLGGRERSARRRGLKHLVVVMIFSIVVAYWACFLPFWGWQLTQLFSPESLKALSPATHNYVNFFVTCLTYSNSCINPFLYTLLTRNYKDYLAQKGQSTVASTIELTGSSLFRKS
ncbi:urotensin-2 receptor-like [Phycodurus eques]|uniref:urotensin-2 receptor-like n=1 Tax=Phycodurus eques TaxID=693459 RepID=UPI002ACE2D44|nr:urotensin-2 receptor-like [Phycodurus eques]